jgi:TetR/AcrR family transcriptional regulator, transcriptional repressor for nem operon
VPRINVREAIVETALLEFHRGGFGACSVDTVTRAAGVPKGSFYNHFTSKEALGAEVVTRYAAGSGWDDELEAGLSPLQQLRVRFGAMGAVLADASFSRGCLMGNMGAELADHSPAVRAATDAGLRGWSDSIADHIRSAQARGEAAADLDADRLGRFVLNAWQGAVLRAKVVKTAEPLDDFFTAVFDTILH